jgi:phenylpyruvate tautomerase PptA (4-oxalocrotonate tautomerase family)
MPYLKIVSSRRFPAEEKNNIKTEFGRIISLFPDKSEEVLMISFVDGVDMFYSGAKQTSSAFIGLDIHGNTTNEAKERFTRLSFDIMKKHSGMEKENIFITIAEHNNWGFQGNWI